MYEPVVGDRIEVTGIHDGENFEGDLGEVIRIDALNFLVAFDSFNGGHSGDYISSLCSHSNCWWFPIRKTYGISFALNNTKNTLSPIERKIIKMIERRKQLGYAF